MTVSRVLRFNLLTAVVLGIAGYFLGWWLGHQITSESIDYFGDTGQNDIALFIAYFVGVIGFLVGPRLPQLSGAADAGPSALASREGVGGHRAATSGSVPTTRSSASST